MRILCCYANNFTPETQLALDLYAPDAERVDTSGPQHNYWREICKRWDGTDDLILIEQSIEITPEVMPAFSKCEHDWCTFGYNGLFGKLEQSLGCTKFSAALQRRFPHDVIAGPNMVWHLIDFRIGKFFGMHGLTCYVHGSVEHHHDYVHDPLQKRNIIQNNDGTFTVTERQNDGTLKVWENCIPKRK
jgi:hypothetical protein